MEEFIQKLREMLANAKTKANEALAGLPPLEQVEAAGEIAYGIRCMQSTVRYFEEQAAAFDQSLQAVLAAAQAKMAAEVEAKLSEKLSGGEYMSVSDAQASASRAADEREAAVVERFETLATRRKALVTGENALPIEVVDALSEDVILADDWEAKLGQVRERLSKLSEKKITSAVVIGDVVRLSLDDAGDKEFHSRLSLIEAVAQAGKTEKKTAPAPLNQSPAPRSKVIA